MLPKKMVYVLNVSLSIIAVMLLLQFLDLKIPSLGQVASILNTQEPQCSIEWDMQISPIQNMDLCCLEVRKQLECHKESGLWVCQTGTGQVLKYLLNSKAYYYCQQQVIWG